MVHKKDDCQRLISGAVRVPSPATLRIPNDHEGKVEDLVAGS